ncbi:MAG: hypothetical protein WC243_02225 [Patescibacteria group bacterium]|jgi:F0F1-type ATP synthase epsilon subunit
MADVLSISVRNRKEIVFEGPIYSVTSYNELGEFDVLSEHANMITLLKDKLLIDKGRPSEKEITFGNALMNITRNEVSVYMDI